MEVKNQNTEQILLEAAEKLFIEKGFDGAKTTEIARLAGVNHALLHYYFRTKKNLFNCVFERIAAQMVGFISIAFEDDAPFFDKLQKAIELHFDGLVTRINLPMFIFREVIQQKERKDYFLNQLFPIAKKVLAKMHGDIKREVKKGIIRPVKAQNVLLNIAALNVFSFIAAEVLFDTKDKQNAGALKLFLNDRKQNNVNTIINSLKL
ncbi:MAG: TetR/AcrR family transcriptional regulator [Dysgonamonadaceae bacterium]|jgi:AcrR family transcriptional regulator|nr:TetR/AcrR family transcriptional regulator [Dysgonamonadaceae bacterium]